MKLIIPAAILFLFACSKPNVEKKKTEYIIRDGEASLEVLTIDSCEYLYGPWGNATVLTHKGNCKHCKIKK